MKKTLIMMLTAMTLCVSACKPTPEEPAVISKNDGKFESAIKSTAPRKKYQAPKTWKEEFDGWQDKVKIKINAEIITPDVDAYPVYRVTPVEQTNESANAFITACIGNEKLYKVDDRTLRPKAVCMHEMLLYQKYIDDPKQALMEEYKSMPEMLNCFTDEELKELSDGYKEMLKQRQIEYNNAPDDLVREEMEREYTIYSVDIGDGKLVPKGSMEEYLQIFGVTEDFKEIMLDTDLVARGGYGKAIEQRKSYHRHSVFCRQYCEAMGIFDNEVQKDMTHDEARKIADDFVHNSLGYKNANVRVSSEVGRGYRFLYTYEIDGIPLLFSQVFNIEKQTYYGPFMWQRHLISIEVMDGEIERVYEQSSIQTEEKFTDNVPLLSFEQIQDIFRKQIIKSADYDAGIWEKTQAEIEEEWAKYNNPDVPHDDPSEVDIEIDKIELGYIVTREKDNVVGNEGILTPVWIFYGKQRYKYDSKDDVSDGMNLGESLERVKGGTAKAFLCLNAVDGSVIDLLDLNHGCRFVY